MYFLSNVLSFADMYDEVLSVSSTDEAFTHLQDENSLYKAQLQEVQGRLAKARKEGQEAAEKKSVGEIKSLRTQLGAKSKYVIFSRLCFFFFFFFNFIYLNEMLSSYYLFCPTFLEHLKHCKIVSAL